MNLKDRIRAIIGQIKFLRKDEVEILVDMTIVDEFEKGTILLREGQIPTRCFMVIEGCVREYVIKNGEEKSIAFYTEGDSFTPPAFNSKPSEYYWECIEDCILTISDKSFEEKVRKAIPRLDAVFQEMAIDEIHKAKAEWSQFITSSPEERYLHLLENKPHLLNRVPHHQLASYLGMKPQSLSRIRKRLSNKKQHSSHQVIRN